MNPSGLCWHGLAEKKHLLASDYAGHIDSPQPVFQLEHSLAFQHNKYRANGENGWNMCYVRLTSPRILEIYIDWAPPFT
jgi:hypothetical protein